MIPALILMVTAFQLIGDGLHGLLPGGKSDAREVRVNQSAKLYSCLRSISFVRVACPRLDSPAGTNFDGVLALEDKVPSIRDGFLNRCPHHRRIT